MVWDGATSGRGWSVAQSLSRVGLKPGSLQISNPPFVELNSARRVRAGPACSKVGITLKPASSVSVGRPVRLGFGEVVPDLSLQLF